MAILFYNKKQIKQVTRTYIGTISAVVYSGIICPRHLVLKELIGHSVLLNVRESTTEIRMMGSNLKFNVSIFPLKPYAPYEKQKVSNSELIKVFFNKKNSFEGAYKSTKFAEQLEIST